MHADGVKIVRWAACLLMLACCATVGAQEQRKLTNPNAARQGLLGFAATHSGDAGFAGAPASVTQPGVGYLFDLETGDTRYRLEPSIQRSDSMFGFNSRMFGDRLLVGDPGNPFGRTKPEGAAYVFDVNSGAELFRLTPSDSFAGDEFGFGINLHDDLAIIGAPHLGTGEGAAYLFDVSRGSQLRKLLPDDPLAGSEFGADVAVSADYALVGAPANFDTLGFAPGYTYVFDVETGSQKFKLQPHESAPGDEFGFDVAIDGNLAVIGAPFGGNPGLGGAYLFDISTGEQLFRLTADDLGTASDFGSAVDIDGHLIAVGANGINDLGAVYLFDARNGRQVEKLTPSDLEAGDAFGIALSLSADRLFVGAARDDDTNFNAGAAYLFGVQQPQLAGDFNDNGWLDVDDINRLTAAVVTGSSSPEFDLDGNGQVGQEDRVVWVEDLFGSYFGDANLDGQFDSGDLVTVLRGGQYEDLIVGNSTWETGDFSGDLEFDTGDLVAALKTGAYEQGPRPALQAVPEPTAGVLVLLALLPFAACRRGFRRVTH